MLSAMIDRIRAERDEWQKQALEENAALDVARDEIAAKDALINKLADALTKIDDACDGDMCKHFINNEHCSKCKYLETCQTGIAHNALKTNESEIAKAREVFSKMETTTEVSND